MNRKEKAISLTLVGLVTIFVVYIAVRPYTGNAVVSVVPGWHTTIFPPQVTSIILTAIVIAVGLLVYLMFNAASKLLILVRQKFKA